MLNRLRLENFKAWREADLTLGKVTGLFGTNSSGKSSLLQLLLLLKQTSDATDRGLVLDLGGPSDIVNLGTYKDVVHRHDESKRMRWLLEWNLPETLEISEPTGHPDDLLFDGDSLEVRCEVGLRHSRLWLYELAYRLDDTNFELRPKRGSGTKFDLATDSEEFAFKRNVGRAWPLPRPVKTHLFPAEVRVFSRTPVFLAISNLPMRT